MGKALSIRLVFDTNIVLSTLLFSSKNSRLLREAWRRRTFIPVISKATTAELMRVLAYPKFQLTRQEREALLEEYVSASEVCMAVKNHRKQYACRDPQDQQFIDLALSAKVTGLVSGDQDILTMQEILPISIYGFSTVLRLL